MPCAISSATGLSVVTTGSQNHQHRPEQSSTRSPSNAGQSILARVSWVRIPPAPPDSYLKWRSVAAGGCIAVKSSYSSLCTTRAVQVPQHLGQAVGRLLVLPGDHVPIGPEHQRLVGVP